MTVEPVIAALQSIFDETACSEVLAAVRQEPLVWNSLASDAEFREGCRNSLAADPWAWNPASLALQALGRPPAEYDRLICVPLLPLAGDLRTLAAEKMEEALRGGEPPASLADAGLLALALRERRRLTDSWAGLLVDLQVDRPGAEERAAVWRAPLVILYALAPDPDALLRSLAPRHANMTWLPVHVLLSSPLSAGQQVDRLEALLSSASDSEALPWLESLRAAGRPELATALALRLPDNGDAAAQAKSAEFDPWRAIRSGWHRANRSAHAHSLHKAIDQLAETRAALRRMEAKVVLDMARETRRNRGPEASLPLLREAVALDPDLVPARLALAETLAGAGNLAEAKAALPDCEDTHVHLSRALIASQADDLDTAVRAADQMAAAAVELADIEPDRVEQLVAHRLAPQAEALASTVLHARPADAALVSAHALACAAQGKLDAAAKSARIAVSLQPGQAEHRRRLASILERGGDFAAALPQRLAVRALCQEPEGGDLEALAACALQAKEPAPAREVGETLLQQNPDNPQAHVFLGEANLQDGAYPEALAHFQQATAIAPELADGWLALARYYQQRGESLQAVETLRAAAQAAPNAGVVHAALAAACLQNHAPTEALPALRKASQLEPKNAAISLQLANTLCELGRVDEASEVLQAARHQDPHHPALAYAQAVTCATLNQTAQARSALRTVLASQPKDSGPYLLFARLSTLDPAADWGEVESALNRVLDEDPDHLEGQILLAESLARQNRHVEAAERYQGLVSGQKTVEPQWNARLKLGMGKSAMRLGQTESALAALQDAAQLQPDDQSIQRELAEAYRAVHLEQEALQAARNALRLNHDSVETLLWFASLADALGQADDCIQALTKASEREPSRPDLQLRLALAYAQANRRTAAIDLVHSAVRGDLPNSDELCQAAYLMLILGETEDAATLLRRAIAEEGGQASVNSWTDLAMTEAMLGRTPEAVEAMESGIRLLGENPAEPRAMAFYARLLDQVGRSQSALNFLQKILALPPAEQPAGPEHSSTAAFLRIARPDCLEASSDPAMIHLNMARILRKIGEVCEARDQAEQAMTTNPRLPAARAAAASLNLALLDEGRLRDVLTVFDPQWIGQQPAEASRLLFLQAEAAVENGDLEAAEAVLSNPQLGASAWRLALQGRIAAQRGDLAASQQLLHQALALPAEKQPQDQSEDQSLALAEAAQAAGEHSMALALFSQATRRSPLEPRGHLAYARALVTAAEASALYPLVGVRGHRPNLTGSDHDAFNKAIEAAVRLSSSPRVAVWKVRGQHVFEPEGEPAPAGDTPYGPILAQRAAEPVEAFFAARALSGERPNDPLAQALLATLAAEVGELGVAVEAMEAALAIWPNELGWQMDAARWCGKCGLMESALNHAAQACALAPDDVSAVILLGQLRLEANQPQAAVLAMEQATQLAPDSVTAWLELSRAHQAQGDAVRAIASAEKAISLAPSEIQPLLDCGELALQAGRYDLVHRHAETALQLDPANSRALLLLVRSLAVEGEPAAALEALDAFLPVAQDPFPLKLERITLLRKIQSPTEVLAALQALDEEYPDEPAILTQLAQALVDCGQREAAEKAAQSSLLIHPEQPGLHLLVGRVQRNAGQLDQSIHHLSEAIRLAPEEPEAYLELGKAYQDRRDHQLALKVYQQVIALRPQDPRGYYQAGLAMKDDKDYEGAETMLRRAAELAPQDVNIRRQLGALIALNLLHKPQEAV